jgi:hypothetical protein
MGKRKAEAHAEGRRLSSPVEGMLDTALDKALSVQRPVIQAYLQRVRNRRPNATPDQVVEMLERRYLYAVTGIGGAAGAVAGLPGGGTAATLASGAGEITAFVAATATYVLALAELHQIPIGDQEVRRALLVAVLVGESGAVALEMGEARGQHWAPLLATNLTKERIGHINARLGQYLIRRFAPKQGALLLGRALPMGIGAGIGALGNAALARSAITAARRAFGPAPAKFPGRVIDA